MPKTKIQPIEDNPIHLLDKLVSLFVYAVTVILVGYMLGTLVQGFVNFFVDINNVITQGNVKGIDLHAQRDLLHTIAFTIVLVKAYRILVSYAKTLHLNIEFIIKLAIVASIIEVTFNSHSYDLLTTLFIGTFGVTNLIIYLVFYDRIRKIVSDHTYKLGHKERG